MKGDEDLGPDRGMDFETDDEENQAERVCEDDGDYESESDVTAPSRSASMHQNIDNPTWPQSYRLSMDMYTSATPPNISFLTGSFLISARKRSQAGAHSSLPADHFQSSTEPLIYPATSLDKDEVPTSYLPGEKLSATSSQLSRFSNCQSVPTMQQCSYAQSLLNAINVLCGIGLLSTPYALKQGGWWSLAILFIFGIITCFTGILLKRCLETSPRLQTYPDIGQAAFGTPGRIFLSIFLYIELYSSCVEYLIMMSDNLSALFPNANMNFSGIHLDSYQLCMITSTLIILPTVWLRNLSLLSVISVGGVFTAGAVSLCLLWVGVVDQVGFHPSGPALDLAKLPVTLGLFGFCYGSHSVFPNIYSSMKEPSKFPSVLIISFSASCLLYAAVAVCGFLMFGHSTKSQFTLNMPSGFMASKVAAWTTVVAPVTKYALTITPVAFSLEELLPSALDRSYSISILIRTILVFSTLVVALTVPYFGSVMAFIGSSLVMLIALIFPCACYLSICRDRLTKLQIWVCILIMNVGLICAIVGTYSAITTIGDEKV
ncbi:amino acid transporter AVT1E-like [Rhododendron vialii]|uniref:amino acid transporter AVT1E-like n=1 Tax=Rhododendron vialii TaxID=182163 RepID=UPI00265ED8DD|nr:amino acid transporter AVT1E-like [Rhododendron vialii]